MREGKYSVYIPADAASVLRRAVAPLGTAPTATFSELAARYLTAIERSLPTLTPGEWALIADALWSTPFDRNTPRLIPVSVAAAVSHEPLAAKWDVDAEALLERLHALRYVELLAIMEVVARIRGDGDAPHREAASWDDRVAAAIAGVQAAPLAARPRLNP